jgi:hypothetical protein
VACGFQREGQQGRLYFSDRDQKRSRAGGVVLGGLQFYEINQRSILHLNLLEDRLQSTRAVPEGSRNNVQVLPGIKVIQIASQT